MVKSSLVIQATEHRQKLSDRMPRKLFKEDYTMPQHCGGRLITSGELALSESSIDRVEDTELGCIENVPGEWYLVRCSAPSRSYYGLCTINLVCRDKHGVLRLWLASTTRSRIENYLESQPAWSLQSISDVVPVA